MGTLNKIFFFALTIILITSITAISATDIQNNDTANNNMIEQQTTKLNQENIQNIKEPTKTIDKQSQTTTKKATPTPVTSYTELYNKLNSEAEENTTIILEGSETYTLTNKITLNERIKNLVIEGNGKIIDGDNKYQFLSIKTPCNILINNLTIKNCNSSTNGGAIYQEAGSLTLNNTLFKNNEVDANNLFRFGGAIALNNTNLNIINSSFTANGKSAKLGLTDFSGMYGGALYFKGTQDNILNIQDSNFTENGIEFIDAFFYEEERDLEGGALFIETNGKTTINNTTFKSNKAIHGLGVSYSGDENSILLIENSLFELQGYEQYQESGGGLRIFTSGKVLLNNNSFKNNIAHMGSGIYYNGFSKSHLEITNSNFTSNGYNPDKDYNSAIGGAISIFTTDGYVFLSNNNFTSNKANTEGGAINYMGNNTSIFIVEKSIFNSNGGYEGKGSGGAINLWYPGNVTINNCNFTGNNAKSSSVLLYSNGIKDNFLIINNSILESNYNYVNNAKGILFIMNNGNISLTNDEFKNNKNNALELEVYEGNILLENNTFDSNNVTEQKGAAYIVSDVTTMIRNITFTNNTGINGSALTYMGIDNSFLNLQIPYLIQMKLMIMVEHYML